MANNIINSHIYTNKTVLQDEHRQIKRRTWNHSKCKIWKANLTKNGFAKNDNETYIKAYEHPSLDDRRGSSYEHAPHYGAVSDIQIRTSSLPAAVLLEVDTAWTQTFSLVPSSNSWAINQKRISSLYNKETLSYKKQYSVWKLITTIHQSRSID